MAVLLHVRAGTVSEVPRPRLCLQQDLRLAGLDPAQVRRIPDRSMPDNLAALCAGNIEVMQAFQPFVEQAVEAGVAHIVCRRFPRDHGVYIAVYDAARWTRSRGSVAYYPRHVSHATVDRDAQRRRARARSRLFSRTFPGQRW